MYTATPPGRNPRRPPNAAARRTRCANGAASDYTAPLGRRIVLDAAARRTLGSEPTIDGLTQPENDEMRFQEHALSALLNGGATQDEAIDGANLLRTKVRE
jgi:hypothetical protein